MGRVRAIPLLGWQWLYSLCVLVPCRTQITTFEGLYRRISIRGRVLRRCTAHRSSQVAFVFLGSLRGKSPLLKFQEVLSHNLILFLFTSVFMFSFLFSFFLIFSSPPFHGSSFLYLLLFPFFLFSTPLLIPLPHSFPEVSLCSIFLFCFSFSFVHLPFIILFFCSQYG